MQALEPSEERRLLRERVSIWNQTDAELRVLRQRGADSVTVPEAIRQIFSGMDHLLKAPAATTSGLVEQQMWFSRIRLAANK